MFKFTIRELLLLTVIAALGVGWVVERQRSARLERQLAACQAESHEWVLRARAASGVLRECGWSVDWSEGRIDIGHPSKPFGWYE